MDRTHCQQAKSHSHTHGHYCGHTAIKHEDHVCYLHDGHLHQPHKDHYDEHVLEINSKNPDGCHPMRGACDDSHVHSESCGHEQVPHGDHTDYLVNGRLHHIHGDHCDDHGPVELVKDR
ncbi:hypothetical protein MO867_21065 [Microbulbifer sp. OS29]|uniref:Threonine dehydratase n=1 Tax=Microbulbifer okhotskensis TaxID=2926617 RepID=A0A9X2J6N2_9GAMM|nr:hypothetical protein [Microbulbifer okhotskensis]MCO1336822.1 hypothetical protein [Microbulbifer okhotskensis]